MFASRIVSSVRWEVMIQLRQGFYFASLIVFVFSALVLSELSGDLRDLLFPVLTVSNVLTNAYAFVAMMYLLERSEGTSEALAVTPLRSHEYLGTKIGSLTLLSVLEATGIAVFGYGLSLSKIPLFIAGVVSLSIIFVLFGYYFVSPYTSFNEAFFPIIAPIVVFNLNLIGYIGRYDSPLFLILPSQPGFILLQDSVTNLGIGQIIISLVGTIVWVVVGGCLAMRAYKKHINGFGVES